MSELGLSRGMFEYFTLSEKGSSEWPMRFRPTFYCAVKSIDKRIDVFAMRQSPLSRKGRIPLLFEKRRLCTYALYKGRIRDTLYLSPTYLFDMLIRRSHQTRDFASLHEIQKSGTISTFEFRT